MQSLHVQDSASNLFAENGYHSDKEAGEQRKEVKRYLGGGRLQNRLWGLWKKEKGGQLCALWNSSGTSAAFQDTRRGNESENRKDREIEQKHGGERREGTKSGKKEKKVNKL